MAAAEWQFILTDSSYVPVGEVVNAYDRTVANPLNKLDTLSFRVRLDNPLVNQLASTTGYIKAYRNGALRFFGPIISADETGDEQNAGVAVNAVGAGWILTKRFAGKTASGRVFSTATDRAEIVRQLILEAEVEGGGVVPNYNTATGLSVDTSAGAGSAITYTAGPYAKIYDIITELATAYDGFDWRVLPVDNWSNNAITSNKIGLFFAAPFIGIQRPEAILEWGGGRYNMKSYTRTTSRDAQANKVFHIAGAGPDAPGYPVVSQTDPASVATYSTLEELATADLSDLSLRQQLVNEHIRVRAQPRQVISITPHINPTGSGRVPDIGTDYEVGDFIRARILYGATTRLDAMVRVWGATFEIDVNGVERVSTVLASDS